MAESNEELAYNNALCERVKRFRDERGWTAAQMATALGIPAERYRKYEFRSPLPAYLMERFCLNANVELENLVLGRPRSRQRPAVVSRQDRDTGTDG
jgi:transcriptional regulator with XRE-family HTH domain